VLDDYFLLTAFTGLALSSAYPHVWHKLFKFYGHPKTANNFVNSMDEKSTNMQRVYI